MLLDGTLWERTFAEYERGSTSVDDAESFVAEPFRRAPQSYAVSLKIVYLLYTCITEYSHDTPLYILRARLLSHSFVVNVSHIDFSNLKP